MADQAAAGTKVGEKRAAGAAGKGAAHEEDVDEVCEKIGRVVVALDEKYAVHGTLPSPAVTLRYRAAGQERALKLPCRLVQPDGRTPTAELLQLIAASDQAGVVPKPQIDADGQPRKPATVAAEHILGIDGVDLDGILATVRRELVPLAGNVTATLQRVSAYQDGALIMAQTLGGDEVLGTLFVQLATECIGGGIVVRFAGADTRCSEPVRAPASTDKDKEQTKDGPKLAYAAFLRDATYELVRAHPHTQCVWPLTLSPAFAGEGSVRRAADRRLHPALPRAKAGDRRAQRCAAA
jgi:hypothetical protein